ncbi:MAG: hypothetical protein RSA60_01580 [Eubacterium sp.]
MQIYCCIDDTDNIDSPGTGTLADEIVAQIHNANLGRCAPVTRHQLYIHPDIPYTSHNSSMCFSLETSENCYHKIIQLASEHLNKTAASGSDPGLAVLLFQSQTDYSSLINFGLSAQKEVLTKENAFDCASKNKIHLSEHGGTGQGVIGALAGIGLRLTGNDGEVKGSLKNTLPDGDYKIDQLLALEKIDSIVDMANGMPLSDDAFVHLENPSKAVWHNSQAVLFVQKVGNQKYKTFSKQYLRCFGETCPHFMQDVTEEWVYSIVHSCYNCRYRRWTSDNFTCLKNIKKGKEEKNESHKEI